MDQIAETFVNRDEPIPVIRTGDKELEAPLSPEANEGGGGLSLQDRLFAK